MLDPQKYDRNMTVSNCGEFNRDEFSARQACRRTRL
jgi:hypothetical protein